MEKHLYYQDVTDTVGLQTTDTLTNKTLTTPVIASIQPSSGKTLTLPDVTDTIVGLQTTDTLTNKTLTTPVIASIQPSSGKTLTLPDVTDTIVGLQTTDTLTNKTLTTPVIASIQPSSGKTLTLPDVTDTLVGLQTSDTLTNKILTEPKINNIKTTSNKLISVPDAVGTICISTNSSNGLTLSDSGDISVNSSQPNITTAGGTDSTTTTISGNLTVNKDLTINGTTTVLNTENLSIEDSLIYLAKGVTGVAVNDAGFIINRGTDDNVGIIWNETDNGFRLISTESDASTNSVSEKTLLDLTVKKVTASDSTISGGSIDGVEIGKTTPATEIFVDNIKIDGNSISSINSNGNINLDCNGIGKVKISKDLDVTGTIYGSINGTISGNAASATILETARTIGGVSFNGSQNIDLPGVNIAGTQDTSGNAATATKIATIDNNNIMTKSGTETVTGSKTFDAATTLKSTLSVAGNAVFNSKVGIGIDNPSSLLHLKSTGDVVLRLEADDGNEGEFDNPLLHLSQDGGAVNTYFGIEGGNSFQFLNSLENYGYIKSSHSFFGFQIATANKAVMTFDESQNVGIGTNNPSEKLHVDGNIKIVNGSLIGNVIGNANTATSCTGNAGTSTVLETSRNIGGVAFNGSADINLPGVNSEGNQNTTGSAATLTTARTIGGVSFDGSADIDLPGVNSLGNQNTTGSAATLTTTRTIGGVAFNGSSNINLPGVNSEGNQNTTGSAATLTTARTIGGVSFDGSADIDLPGVNSEGNQNTTGSAATLTTSRNIGGVAFNGSADINLPGVNSEGNQNTTGSAATLTTSRNIGGVAFNGSADINLPGVNSEGNQNTTGSAATLTTARTIGGVSFDGSTDINLPGVNSEGNQNTTGSAATLTTSRNIGGVAFNGSADIDLPGVNSEGNQNTTGSAATLTTSRNIGGVAFNGSADINLPGVNSEGNQNTTGSAATLTTARNIGGVAFNGSTDINLPGVNSEGNQNTTGSAATLTTARNIGGVAFNGSTDINLPGVNSEGNQNTTGSAATLTTARNIGGVAFNGSTDINLPGVNSEGNQNTTGSAATLTTSRNIGGVAFNGSADINLPGVNSEGNQNTTGSAATLTTARNIGGVAFNGSTDINLPGVNSEGNQNTTGSAATLTTARNIGGVAFNGSTDINLPGVNSEGNQNTTGSAATLTTARNIGGVAFNGSTDINLPGVNSEGNQNTTGSAATLTTAGNIGGVAFNGSTDINLPGVNSEGNQDTTGNANSVTDGVYLSTSQTITGEKTFNAATTLKSSLSVAGNSELTGYVGVGTAANSNHSLNIASTGDNKVRILASSNSNNAQIMFSRLNLGGNDYGPEIIFDKYSSPAYGVDSLNLVATNGALGMNITWDGKVGIGGTNSTGDNLLVNGTFKATGNAQISSNLIVDGDLTINGTTTTINTTNLDVQDSLIYLANGFTGTPSKDAGFLVERGSENNVGLIWDESDDKFKLISTASTATDNVITSINFQNLELNDLIVNGNVTGDVTGNVTGSSGSCTGNAATATTASEAQSLVGLNDLGSGEIITSAERTKLNQLDTGAVMKSGNQTITGAKTFNAATILNSTLSVAGNSIFNGNVGIGITDPGSKLHLFDTEVGNSSTLTLERNITSFGGSNDGCAAEFKVRESVNGASRIQGRIRGIDDRTSDSNGGGLAFDSQNDFSEYKERMRISYEGNVGIGTDNPTEKLHVYGGTSDNEPLALFQDTGDCGVRIQGQGGEAYLELANTHLDSGSSTHSWGIGMNDNKYLKFNWKNNGNMNNGGGASGVGTGEVNAMTIKDTGDVGIGTDNPGAKLHIYGDASKTEIFLGESAAIDKSGIIKYDQGDGTGTGKLLIGNWGDSLLTKSLSVKKGGNVGIGTDGPSQKLHVNEGKISVTHGHGILVDSYGDGAGPRIGFGSVANQDNILKIGSYDNHNNIDTPEANRDLRIRFGATPVTSTTFKHNGNVGIGITNPSSLLHLKQTNSASDCIIKIEADRGVNSNIPLTGIEFKSNDGDPTDSNTYISSKILSGWIQGEDDYDDSFFKIQTYHTNSSTDLQDTLVIKGPNVGIGNDNPSEKLTVTSIANHNTIKLEKLSQGGTNSIEFSALDGTGVGTSSSATWESGKIVVEDERTHGASDGGTKTSSMKFFTSVNDAPSEKMSLRYLNNKNYVMLKEDTTIWASKQEHRHAGKLTLQAGWSGTHDVDDPTSENANMSSIVIEGYKGAGHKPQLQFKTKSEPRMTIMNNGEIGIGTTEPTQKIRSKWMDKK